MSNTAEHLAEIQNNIPAGVKLIAVSKFRSLEAIRDVYRAGQRMFGENKAIEMRDKHSLLPNNIQWHFIGHLQTNKVKYIIPFVGMIHSVDSLKLLETIDHFAKVHDRTVDCLLQFHIAEEESKFGFSISEAKEMLESETYKNCRNIRLCGVMGMATFTDDEDRVRCEFRMLKNYFAQLKENYFPQDHFFKEISMGMTNDYVIAIEEGSTMVRIGSAIFANDTL
ncbi:MAG: YggS family pyridoxal phosphate-dependent enzyme [Bacteroidales bacterium]|jgi:pyridoxal phosphate enzyme (YggS family)|nr:YggS family pyridoxal phosphate-dependent enzyme [Bacteroidales bacterium]